VTKTKKKPGPAPKYGRDDLRALIRSHRGNIKRIAAVVGMSRNGIIEAVKRENLQAEVDAARRGWSLEAPDVQVVDEASADKYPLLEVLRATRGVLGARLAQGERAAVLQWLHFLRSLGAMGVLRPTDYADVGGVPAVKGWSEGDDAARIDPGVLIALKAGRVTPDEILAGYGSAAATPVFEALLVGTKPDSLRASLAQTAATGAVITDASGILRSVGVDVLPMMRRGARPGPLSKKIGIKPLVNTTKRRRAGKEG
jgi:hypothetical protein